MRDDSLISDVPEALPESETLLVKVGSPAFYTAGISNLSTPIVSHMLADWETLHAQPQWVAAAIEAHYFDLDGPVRANGFKANLRNQHTVIGSFCSTMINLGDEVMHLNVDPGSGLAMDIDSEYIPIAWSSGQRAAFGLVVDHVISQLPAVMPERKKGKNKSAVVPSDVASNCMAMLLCTACAMGENKVVQTICERWPLAMSVPVSQGSVRTGNHREMIAPFAVALLYNNRQALEILAQHGADVLGPALWVDKKYNQKVLHESIDPNGKGVQQVNVFGFSAASGSSFAHGRSVSFDSVYPSTGEFILKRAVQRLVQNENNEVIGAPDHGLHAEFIAFCQDLLRGGEYLNWQAAFENSHVCAQFADRLVGSVIEGIARNWSGRTRPTEALVQKDLAILDSFLKHVHWSSLTESNFPPNAALEATGYEQKLALHIARRCIEMGQAHLLSQPHDVVVDGVVDRSVSVVHEWASRGLTPMVLLCLEHGADGEGRDPQSGKTLLEMAKGASGTEAVVRAHICKMSAMRAIHEMNDARGVMPAGSKY